ncbi:ubiquitin carboxyl-terminal hydrolase 15-like isoform X2 [Mugil cephalus]|uniref:ubiquitin carboxyl-terminal hydrolase 15-like isoform X2 n=1 Tax=Mugil cephalus TaxID=48193 RepID=UPI001FB8359E|nr:ubiquitin carboxyl-terminal hydrolase 15-like isoform X2 [Mugil cephalus]
MNFWSNLFSSSPPANINYHGLMNQGSTCYLNSVLQVLFMTKDFREAVKRYTEENPDTECIDHDLKDLFKDLVERTTYTYKITRKLGITKVYEQQDAAEYFEKILRLTSPEASKIFHGKLTHETTCCKCDTKSGTTEPFWHLPLALVDSSSKDYSVEDGIQQFFKASEFNGDNQMYCDTCDDKNDATTQYVIRNHPDVLMLLLKRFEFNYYYMKYFKIDRVVAVPYSLQIPEGQTYELYAVVDHFGDLMSGHYAATIKEENGDRWFSFNDTRVTLFDYQPFQMDNTEKSQSAYLLFYRKKKTDTQHSCGVSHSEDQPIMGNVNEQDEDAEKNRDRDEVNSNGMKTEAINYHGLKNQGSTCYLNSVLQVLFMTKDFREAVNRYREENTGCIDHDLKDLFKDLEERTTNTYKITRKLGIVKVYEQQDAAEYFEKILRLTSPEASQIFEGKLTRETTCCKCRTKSGITEQFWNLPLALVDSSSKDYSVEDGIQQFFKSSELIGDNQMYCDTCDDQNDATTQYVIRNHPDVLMLLLKRFEFNYYYMKYFKINRVVAVPYSLQIPEGQTYELHAVVDHIGDLMSGHYTATIKEENGDRWFSFNDTRVTLFDYQPFQMDNTEKSRSAYLLFYRKKKTDTQHSCGVSHSEDQPIMGNVNEQDEDAEKNRDRDEGEDDAENGNDTAVSVSINRNIHVGVVSVEAPPPGRSENVKNPDNEVDVRQTEQDSRQDHDSYKNGEDEYVDKQGSDGGKKMEDDGENMGGKAEVDDQGVNGQLICTETTSVEDQKKAVIQKNREESEEESLVEDQQQDNGELVSVRQSRNEHQDSKQRTGHYDVVEQNKGRRSQNINKDQVKTRRPMSVQRVSVEKNEDAEIITYRLMQKGKHSGNDERVDDTRQKERTDYPECKREISDTSRNISLRQMGLNVDSRRRDKHVQSRGSTVHCSVC